MNQIDEEDEDYASDQERYIEKASSDRDEFEVEQEHAEEETAEGASGEKEAEVKGNE